MIVWKPANTALEAKSLTKITGKGTTRRAINLLPSPVTTEHEVLQTSGLRYHQLLVTLEGTRRTGVMKIVNPKTRSRAAILIYRGRVLGCIYGRKGLNGQFMHCDAHRCALSDLATGGNLADLYPLTDELALATASLFHGTILDVPTRVNAKWQFDWALAKICASGKPGCIVLSAAPGETIAMVYVAFGRIIGVYCEQRGWVQSNPESAHVLMKGAEQTTQISASLLDNDSFASLSTLSFSLTGLADREKFQQRILKLTEVDACSYSIGADRIPTISIYSHMVGLMPASWKTQPIAPKSQQTFAIQP